jgi:hypothetical protein
LERGYAYVVASDGSITGTPIPDNPDGSPVTTTYITVDSGTLPLTRPLRFLPGGDILANAIDPTMTKLVDAGYNDGLGLEGNPAIPANPTVPRPMKPFSSLSALDAGDLGDSAQQGLDDGVNTAQDDLENPTNFVTKPVDEIGNLPVLSSLTSGASGITPFSTSSANKVVPNAAKVGTSSSTGNSNPLKKIGDDFNSSLKKFADSLKKKPAASEPGDGAG